jgi:hypothetical protein
MWVLIDSIFQWYGLFHLVLKILGKELSILFHFVVFSDLWDFYNVPSFISDINNVYLLSFYLSLVIDFGFVKDLTFDYFYFLISYFQIIDYWISFLFLTWT